MDRRNEILKYISKDQLGIEIGPYHSPLTPKRQGYNCLVMDVFDGQTIRARAAENPALSDDKRSAIEDVDLVGPCTHIDRLVEKHGHLGQFDYIVSSHNFEHLPNPIRFLQGCAKVLKPGGVISMAIPDRRACYDYFRPFSRLADWLDAWFQDRSRPTLAQAFDDQWVRASYDHHGVPHGSFFLGADPKLVSSGMTIEKDFLLWKERLANSDEQYYDAHCSVFTPATLELLLRDSAYLGLIEFEVVEISSSPGVDIFVHLRSIASENSARPGDYRLIRDALLHRALDEGARASTIGFFNERHDVLAMRSENEKSQENLSTLDAVRKELDIVRSELVSVRAALKDSKDQEEMARRDAQLLGSTVSELYNSTSWHITAPIRALKRAIKRSAA